MGEQHDPETLRALLAAFFDEMRQQIEAFGGTVEKFADDAIMAVFGVPRVSEDDAERAVRAAFGYAREPGRGPRSLTLAPRHPRLDREPAAAQDHWGQGRA